jgi:hypothetical protein
VLAETDYLIQKYAGLDAELLLLDEVALGVYELAPFDRADIEKARLLVDKYRDLEIGLSDASIVVLAERYQCPDVLTLDHRHFRALRHSGRRMFHLLPADQ